MALTLPISANIRPTSPRGTIEIPIRALFLIHFCMIKNAPINLLKKAINIKESPIIQKENDEKSMMLKSMESPTITKKIGVNI